MALQNVEVISVQKKQPWYLRFATKTNAAVVAVSAAAVSSAHAEGLDSVGTVVTGQMTSATDIVTTVLIAGITFTALIIGYRKLNSGAKAA